MRFVSINPPSHYAAGCNETVVLGQKDKAMTGDGMLLWHLPIPSLRNGGTSTPFLRLPAHS
eukprot:scaffold128134_cov13-Tisochrysis_lutea.AAC.1